LSKKRDALRRGIRELLQDTSKDLVAFEGHEVGRGDAPSVPHSDAPALNGGPLETPEEHPAASDAAPAAETPSPEPARDAAGSRRSQRDLNPAPAAFELIADTAPSRAASSPAAPKRPKRKRGAGTRKERRAPAPRSGRRSAPAPDDAGEDSVNPMPVQSRTGVCRSYFINHECWRVPNAYCNTALQVCVIRNCPVYHLHKDALERRFAKKFKHFW